MRTLHASIGPARGLVCLARSAQKSDIAGLGTIDTGHLVNGAFALAQPLQARAVNAANPATTFADVGSAMAPLSLLTYSGLVSNDPVTLQFRQLIAANDPLRTGTYRKTLTFTLSTTTP